MMEGWHIETPNFKDRIKTAKKERLDNIWYSLEKECINIAVSEIKEKWINDKVWDMIIYSIERHCNISLRQEAKNSYWQSKEINEDSPIIKEIIERWPFENEEELADEIARYVVENMSYDLISWLLVVGEKLKKYAKKQNSEGKKGNRASEAIKLFLEWRDNIKISQKDFTYLLNKIEEYSSSAENKRGINTLIEIMRRQDIVGFKRYLIKLPEINYNLFSEIWYIFNEIEENRENNSINTMLKEIKIWVCRDFSIMIKEIYNKIISGWLVEFDWESEMIYVLNNNFNHAYNLLMYEKNWEVKKKYIDVTPKISWQWDWFDNLDDLLKNIKDKEGMMKLIRDSELWVNTQERKQKTEEYL